MKRVGIFESQANKTIKLIGYGEYLGNEIKFDECLSLDLSYNKVKLDSGMEILVSDARMAEESIIQKEIEDFKSKGFTII